MSHLTEEQLSALVDGALEGRARSEAERHLESCAACRQALAGLVEQESALRAALEHDPGEAYFESFAGRVGGRLRAAGLSGAQARPREGRTLADWFRSPRKLAWVAATAAVVAGAAIVVITSREWRLPALRDHDLRSRAAQEEPVEQPPVAGEALRATPAPAPQAKETAAAPPGEAGAPEAAKRQTPSGSPASLEAESPAESKVAPPAGARAPASRAYEVRRDAHGEDVPVRRPGNFIYRPPRSAPAPAAPGEPVRVQKQRYAEPMHVGKGSEALRGGARPAPADEATAPAAESPAAAPPVPAPAAPAPVAAEKEASPVQDALKARYEALAQERAKTDSAPLRGFLDAAKPSTLAGRSAALQTVAADPFEGQSTYTRTLARNARRLSALAERIHAPTAWDSAAAEWERVLEATVAGPLENETRYQIARARFMAWRGGVSEKRTSRVTAALDAFLARVTQGARHDEAGAWLAEVKK